MKTLRINGAGSADEMPALAHTMAASGDTDDAVQARTAMVDSLVATKMITSPRVEQAFRTVPRHLFVADNTALDVAYDTDCSVAIKQASNGVIMSSTSAPFIQAQMIEQAGLTPGASVLEIGSGGYNAALLAEIVGPTGRVVSVDIDQEVTDRAAALLAATGYGSRVTVVHADAENPLPQLDKPVDAILVTVGAWDLAPAWLDRLADHSMLVVPLRMNGVTRSIGFRRAGDHLVSTSAHVCGFVPMQGAGAHDDRTFLLPDRNGHHVTLRFDDGAPDDASQLDSVLATDRTEAWSGVTVDHSVSFADLHLWFASFLPGFCRLAVDEGTELAAERTSKKWFPFGVVRDGSLAYLAVRPSPDDAGLEFGARAYGAHGQTTAIAMVDQIQAWDRHTRRPDGDVKPTFAYWPTGAQRPEFGSDTGVVVKTHGVVTISWPPAAGTGCSRDTLHN